MRSLVDLSRLAAALGGLPVLGCLEGSSAAEAGIRYGDVLLAVDGIGTGTWDDYLTARGQAQGRFIARIFRDGAEFEVEIELRPPTRSPMEVLGELIERGIAPRPIDDETDSRH
jgi:S1-C subfamily serine protease